VLFGQRSYADQGTHYFELEICLLLETCDSGRRRQGRSHQGCGDSQKYRFSSADVKGCHETPSIRAGFHGMALSLHGRHDVKFEFWSKSSRDDVSHSSSVSDDREILLY
jgi:hypothetical protein